MKFKLLFLFVLIGVINAQAWFEVTEWKIEPSEVKLGNFLNITATYKEIDGEEIYLYWAGVFISNEVDSRIWDGFGTFINQNCPAFFERSFTWIVPTGADCVFNKVGSYEIRPAVRYEDYDIYITGDAEYGDVPFNQNFLSNCNIFTIYDITNIYIKSPGSFSSTCPNSSFTHDLTIGNSGGTLEQNFKVCIYASQDQAITISDYLLGCFTVTPSHFGSRNYCDLSITCDPSGLSGGTWYFGIIVDPDDELEEDNKDDNSYCSSTPTLVEDNSMITVTSPNSNEEWELGSTHNITWSSNVGGYVKIELYKQGSFYQAVTSSTNNDGSFSWSIPADYDEYASYRIRITSTSNSNIYDYSDNYFSLKSPEQSDVVWPGDTNNNGYVDQADVLPIGMYFHFTGPSRSINGNQWRACEFSGWTNNSAGYADSNGDGTVDQGDILAIGLNWHKSHTAALAKSQINIIDRSLAINLESGMDSRGPFIEMGVQNADGLTGISFELDLNLIEGNITSIKYLDAFQTDRVQYENIQADKLALGVSLKNSENALNGSAKLCRVYYQGQHSDSDIRLFNIVGMNNRGECAGAVSESYSLACGQIVAPDKLVLYPNYPNPFNPITTIKYDLPESGLVRLDILNVKGEVVRTLVHQQQAIGSYAVQWDATREDGSIVASGVYLYRIQSSDQQFIHKLLYTK